MPTKTKRNTKPKTKAELDYEQAKKTFAIATSIYKANTSYDKATPAQRRVMIAEDALEQLKIGRFVATPGTYVNACALANEAKLQGEVQLNTLLHNPAMKSSCNVCARGALLLSAVRFRNDCIIGSGGYTSDDSFVKEFEDQQEEIETAFEEYTSWDLDKEDQEYWADKFLTKKERNDPEKRLELIFQNIIRNKGTFKENQR